MPARSDTHHFKTKHCLPRLRGETKEEVITELIQCFVASGTLDETQAIDLGVEILGREEEATTGIGKGVAMPHARATSVIDGVEIAVGVHEEGVEWEALDGALVHVVFLIASSDPQRYLQVAGRVARVARDEVEVKALPRQGTASKMVSFLEEAWSGSNS